jgi:hypothetical protein
MTETITIFNEFVQSAQDVNTELRHQKRVRLEPLIFDILKKKYGAALDKYWDTVGPRIHPEKCILLIERRIHENLEFCIKNAAYFGRDWTLGIICSQTNLEYIKTILGKHIKNVAILPFFKDNPGRDQARQEYNQMLMDPAFYKSLPWKNIITMQTDSYFRRAIPPDVLAYDYIAAPASWDMNSMVGGLSYRNREAMIRICEEFKETIPSEDLFLDTGAKHLNLRRPPYDKALEYVSESLLFDDPIGVHQWWTFFTLDMDDAEEFFHLYVTLECI